MRGSWATSPSLRRAWSSRWAVLLVSSVRAGDVGHAEVVVGGGEAAQHGQRPLDGLRSGPAAARGRHDVDLPRCRSASRHVESRPCRSDLEGIAARRPCCAVAAPRCSSPRRAASDDDDGDGAAAEHRRRPAADGRAGRHAADAGADAGPASRSRCASATSRTSPTPRRSSASRPGCSQDALGADVDARAVDVQLRHRGHRGAVLRRPRRQFIGPNPAINGYAKSDGEALRIVAGTTSGGASLVVREGIDDAGRPRRHDARHAVARQHPGRRPAGVARRAGLRRPTPAAAATSSITPQDNADTLAAFQAGAIDGAWVPEPWATRLVDEGGGHVLVDEADLWPDGRVRHDPPDRRHRVPRRAPRRRQATSSPGSATRSTWPTTTPPRPRRSSTTASRRSPPAASPTRRSPAPGSNLAFTLDPIASSLQGSADDAIAVGLLDPVDLADPGIYDLTLLNEVLAERGEDRGRAAL